ncbi:restriction endonuclease subunit S [Pseudomonas graminis]
MTKYQAYPEYKDSGVEWLDCTPAHWSNAPIKYLALDTSSLFLDGDWIESKDISEEGIRYITTGNVGEGCYKEQGSGFITEKTFSKLNCTEVFEGDVLISRLNNPIGRACLVPDLGYKTVTSVDNVIFRTDKNYNRKYLVHLFSSKDYFQHTGNLARGTTMQRISRGLLGNIRIPLPTFLEQIAIAAFLDHETKKIDSLIEKQQQLVELLKEKRQAMISHAVTKGLNPDVPMKDSGVEWLGEIPESWIVKRLKHITPKVGVGLVINPSTYTRDEGAYFIFGGDVKEYGFDLSKTRRISLRDSDLLRSSRLNYNDVVSIRVGYPGITAVVTEELDGSNCASIIIIRKGFFNSDWLCAAMNVWVGRQQVDLASYGAAQKQFNVSDAIDFVFPVPSINEQQEISFFINKILNKFERLSSESQKQISLLKERRTALISAAVTGKIDLRNWVAPAASEAPSDTASQEVNA